MSPTLTAEFLKTGIDSIDAQHRGLFEMIHRFSAEAENGFDAEVIESFLENLKRYADRHFTDEELLMARIRYPNVGHHQSEHDVFLSRINRYAIAARTEPQKTAEAVLAFIHQWLVEHIQVTDMGYVSHASELGIGVVNHSV